MLLHGKGETCVLGNNIQIPEFVSMAIVSYDLISNSLNIQMIYPFFPT